MRLHAVPSWSVKSSNKQHARNPPPWLAIVIYNSPGTKSQASKTFSAQILLQGAWLIVSMLGTVMRAAARCWRLDAAVLLLAAGPASRLVLLLGQKKMV
jgi:hypothetical protein